MDEKKTGTTVIGLMGRDFVVLAADRQVTYGFTKYVRDEQKIYPIADYMAIGTSGSVGDTRVLVRYLENRIVSLSIERGEKPSPESIVNYLALLLNSTKFFPFFVGLIIGGYKDRPYLASVDMTGGVVENKRFLAEGSGMPYAMAVLEENYREDLKVDEGIKLAIKAVDASRKLDLYSGGDEPGVDVAVINKDGVKMLKEREIASYRK